MHHIVFVDDTSYNLELAQAYLEVIDHANLHVAYYDHADRAIAACKSKAPDLVFLDLEMPKQNGFDAIQSLRRFCHAPVVAMTGHSEASIKDALISHQFNDYLGKPFDEDALIEMVRKYLSDVSITQAAPSDSTPQEAHTVSLNIDDMSRRLRQNYRLIIRILDSFQSNNTHTFSALNHALETQDWISAKRICHTLKGGGANIGADALSSLASELEITCIQHEQPTASQLNALNQLINQTITDCRQYIQQHKVN